MVESGLDHAASEGTVTSSSSTDVPQGNRRRYTRIPCRVNAKVAVVGTEVYLPGTVTDISPGGCYVEMLSPLPVDTEVELTLTAEGHELACAGKVRSMEPGMGMGVSFAPLNAGQLSMLRQIVPEMPENMPIPIIVSSAPHKTPAAPPTTTEALEAVVRLLLHKGILTRAEFSEEIEKIKSAKH